MVLIGGNGAGKSSFLIALYQIIAGGLIEPQTIKNFALMYLDENRQIRIKTTLPETAIKKQPNGNMIQNKNPSSAYTNRPMLFAIQKVLMIKSPKLTD
jgi:ABC-type branched-subunit amino acid transport system ATPase component